MATKKSAGKKAIRKSSAKPKAKPAGANLQYLLFSASERRSDRWSRLNIIAGNMNIAGVSEKEAAALHAKADALLSDMAALEGYWAYPGKSLFGAVTDALKDSDYGYFHHVVGRISMSLKSESYRRKAAAWDMHADADEDIANIPDYHGQHESSCPYFEVLVVVADANEDRQERVRQEIRSLRKPDDPFIYELVYVSSFQDALIATLVNFNIQAVVIYDGFPYASSFSFPELDEFLRRSMTVGEDSMAWKDYALELAAKISNIRPELDAYLMTDHDVEDLAGQVSAPNVRRVFFGAEETMELHLSLLAGVGERYETPFFDNLKKYARRPVGTFHALPVARGKSIYKSHWIQDMGHFYGANLFLAESSATSGGLDSLLEPTGNIKKAHEKAARCFGSDHTYFVTNGTSTANKIVVQGVCKPGDIVLIDRNCHKSHHYGLVLSGAQPLYMDAFPLVPYSMYGAVPLRSIKETLLQLKAEGKLDKVRMLLMTNVTFDGHLYNVMRVMEECLAIKPDLIFLWDEAWYAFGRFSPFYRRTRTAMGARAALEERYATDAYREEYSQFKKKIGNIDIKNKKVLSTRLLPDPDQVRLRVYCTQSTHKSLSALRQGSMIHVNDQDFADDNEEAFEEAFMTHTSTSPNQQIIASLDVARRQAELEGYELVTKQILLALEMRHQVNRHPLISKYFRFLEPADLIPAEYRKSGLSSYNDPSVTWKTVVDAWEDDEFALDPTRLTLVCGTAGYDGTEFKGILAEEYDIQLNKTTRNTVLFQSNINNSRSATAYVIETLVKMSRQLDNRLARASRGDKAAFVARVKSLMEDVPDLPDFSHFHDKYRNNPKSKTREGKMREAFFAAYEAKNCEHITLFSKEIDERLRKGPDLVSANFVIPYPPGFPIMVPGQVISRGIINFMRELDVKEIHGYRAELGIKLIKLAKPRAALGKP
ncbi:MAG: decarboxylase [Proteobacteria bacterium]|nr:decarboxylase [Pseudomonadota bacterium]